MAKKRTKAPSDMTEALRELLRKEGAPSRYEVSRATGIDQGSLSRFFNGGGLRLDNAERIAGALGYELRLARRQTPRKKETQT